MVSSSRCLRFSNRIIAWCPCNPESKTVQPYLRDFCERVPLVLSFGHHPIQGCPFQVAGERTAFLSFSQVFFLRKQLYDFYPGIYTYRFLNTLLDFSLQYSSEKSLQVPVKRFKRVAIGVASREYPA